MIALIEVIYGQFSQATPLAILSSYTFSMKTHPQGIAIITSVSMEYINISNNIQQPTELKQLF